MVEGMFGAMAQFWTLFGAVGVGLILLFLTAGGE